MVLKQLLFKIINYYKEASVVILTTNNNGQILLQIMVLLIVEPVLEMHYKHPSINLLDT